MPMNVPSVEGQITSPDFAQAPQAPVQNRGQDIAGNQMQRAGNALQSAGAGVMRVAQGVINDTNDAHSKQQASLHAVDLDKVVRDYESLRAGDANHGRASVDKAIGELQGRYAKALKNPTQSTLYKRMVDAQVAQMRGRVDKHFAKQTRVWNVEQTEVAIGRNAQEYQEAAVLGDEHGAERTDRMETARGVMLREFDKVADMAGWHPDVTNAKREAHLSNLHTSTVAMLSDGGSPGQARDYFEENQGEMNAKARIAAGKVLDAQDVKDNALATMRSAFAAAGEDATPTQRLESAMSAAKDITDADQFNAVMSFAGAEYQRLVRVEAGAKNDLLSEAEQAIWQPGAESLTFFGLKPVLQEKLRAAGMVGEVMSMFGTRDRVTDGMALHEVMANPAMLKGMPAEMFTRKYRPRMSVANFGAVENMWKRVNGLPTGKPVASVLDHKDAITQVMNGAGYTAEAMKGSDALRIQGENLMVRMQEGIESGKIVEGMPYKEVRTAVEEIMVGEKAKVPGTFYDDDVPLHAMAPGAVIDLVVGGKPVRSLVGAVPDVRTKNGNTGDMHVGVATAITERLRAMGDPIDERTVQESWFMLGEPRTYVEFLSALAKFQNTQERVPRILRNVGDPNSYTGAIESGINEGRIMRSLMDANPGMTIRQAQAKLNEMKR
jgi:hypothetical protein